MSRADSIALPTWALNQEAHALVEQIIAERPDSFLRPYEGSRINGETVFKGSTAGRLRVMHSDWLDRELAALDHQFDVTGHWDDDASKALFGTEDGNQLVERVLRETAQVAVLDLTVEPLGDDVYRVAA